MSFFAGLDWGSTGHAVCVLDEKGAVVARLEVGTMPPASPTCSRG